MGRQCVIRFHHCLTVSAHPWGFSLLDLLMRDEADQNWDISCQCLPCCWSSTELFQKDFLLYGHRKGLSLECIIRCSCRSTHHTKAFLVLDQV